jgi:putative endonuclease
MFFVYIIRSIKTKRYYIGCTKDIERRLKEHNNNKTFSLKNRGPFELIYKEKYLTLKEARVRERQIKSYKSGNAFKKLIKRV